MNILLRNTCLVAATIALSCAIIDYARTTPTESVKAVKTDDTTQKKQEHRQTLVDEFYRTDLQGHTAVTDSLAYAKIKDLGIQHPHIVLAQMKLESGNYKSALAKNNNNYFGMRHPAQRLTVSMGSKNGYAKYRSWVFSVLDYALWQRCYAYNLTEEEYLTKLSRVYAEDKSYASKVKNIAKNLENEK